MEEMPLPELAAWGGGTDLGEEQELGCAEFLCNSHVEITSGS